MINFEKEVAKMISECTKISEEEIVEYIEIPPDDKMGDYAFPCFKLAKTLKKAPVIIASEIKENIKINEEIIEKMETIGG